MKAEKLKVGIFVFNEVEVLDFAGPFEVFSIASDGADKLFEVVTIAENQEIISARNGLKIQPTATFSDELKFDILIIPGGYGAEEIEIKNKNVLDWINKQYSQVNILASVCTGALLLAECGILNDKNATTHYIDLNRLENDYPLVKVIRKVKFVDQGNLLTSAGISAGINMSFHIISRLFGLEIATQTAERMEYDIAL
jgi:transcriptional regulator GlxA family with amidase domain